MEGFKAMIKILVNEVLKMIGIVALVKIVWELLELIILGVIICKNIDNVIASVLSISLYYNLRCWNNSNNKSSVDMQSKE